MICRGCLKSKSTLVNPWTGLWAAAAVAGKRRIVAGGATTCPDRPGRFAVALASNHPDALLLPGSLFRDEKSVMKNP
jgi:hypothetical protein